MVYSTKHRTHSILGMVHHHLTTEVLTDRPFLVNRRAYLSSSSGAIGQGGWRREREFNFLVNSFEFSSSFKCSTKSPKRWVYSRDSRIKSARETALMSLSDCCTGVKGRVQISAAGSVMGGHGSLHWEEDRDRRSYNNLAKQTSLRRELHLQPRNPQYKVRRNRKTPGLPSGLHVHMHRCTCT